MSKVGSFIQQKALGGANNNSARIRARFNTGPQYFKRKVFPAFQRQPHGSKNVHRLHRRVAPAKPAHIPSVRGGGSAAMTTRAGKSKALGSGTDNVFHREEWKRYKYLGGDVASRPAYDFTFSDNFNIFVDVSRGDNEGVGEGQPTQPSQQRRQLSHDGSPDSDENYGEYDDFLKVQRASGRDDFDRRATQNKLRFRNRSTPRKDKVMYVWPRRYGRRSQQNDGDDDNFLQLYQVHKREVFVCFNCGYPVKSAIFALRNDNWDFRMCYDCYKRIRRLGAEGET